MTAWILAISIGEFGPVTHVLHIQRTWEGIDEIKSWLNANSCSHIIQFRAFLVVETNGNVSPIYRRELQL